MTSHCTKHRWYIQLRHLYIPPWVYIQIYTLLQSSVNHCSSQNRSHTIIKKTNRSHTLFAVVSSTTCTGKTKKNTVSAKLHYTQRTEVPVVSLYQTFQSPTAVPPQNEKEFVTAVCSHQLLAHAALDSVDRGRRANP